MIFSLKDLEILDKVNCYNNKYDLVINEITKNEKHKYMSDSENLKVKIEDWFFTENCGHRANYIYVEDDKWLYFFDSENRDTNDYYLLLEKFIRENKIKTADEFYVSLIKLKNKFINIKLCDWQKEILKNTYGYQENERYELAEQWSTEEDRENYINNFSNFLHKFEDWYYFQQPKAFEVKNMLIYVDSDKMFITDEKRKITSFLVEFLSKTINTFDEFEKVKQKYIND